MLWSQLIPTFGQPGPANSSSSLIKNCYRCGGGGGGGGVGVWVGVGGGGGGGGGVRVRVRVRLGG